MTPTEQLTTTPNDYAIQLHTTDKLELPSGEWTHILHTQTPTDTHSLNILL